MPCWQAGMEFAAPPFRVAFCQKRGNEAPAKSGARKEGSSPGTPLEFALDAFDATGFKTLGSRLWVLRGMERLAVQRQEGAG